MSLNAHRTASLGQPLARPRDRARLLATTALLAALSLVTVPALAQTWDGQTDSDWATGENWDPDGVPGAADDVTHTGDGGDNQPVVTGAQSVGSVGVSGGTLTIDGVLTTGGAGVTVSGTGVVAINGQLAGDLTLSGGTVNIGADPDFDPGPPASSPNLYAVIGSTTVNDGTLSLLDGSGTRAITNLSGTGGTVSIGAGSTLGVWQNAGAASYEGNIAGAGAIQVIADPGSALTLTGNLTHSGAIVVQSGDLIFDAGATTQSTSLWIGLEPGTATVTTTTGGTFGQPVNIFGESGSTLALGGSETVGVLGLAGNITIADAATVLTLAATVDPYTYGGIISGDGALVVDGADATLTGANTYAGGTTVTSGALTIGNATQGSIASDVTVGAGGTLTVAAGGTVFGNVATGGSGSNAGTIGGNLDVTGGTFTLTGSVTGDATVTGGTLQLDGGDVDGTLGVSNGATVLAIGDTTLTGLIAGVGSGSTGTFAAAAGQTLTLGTGILSYLGGSTTIYGSASATGTVVLAPGSVTDGGGLPIAIQIAGGTLQIGNAAAGTGALAGSDSKTVGIASGARLDVNGFATTVNNLGGGGTIINNGGAGTLVTAFVGSGSSTFSGSIQNGTSTLGLVKTGAGTLTLTGSSGYTADTTVSAGTLVVTGSIGSLGITVADGAVLSVDGAALSDSAAVTLNGTGNLTLTGSETIGPLNSGSATSTVTLGANTLTVSGGSFAGVIDGTGGLTKTGAATLFLSADHTYTGATSVLGGGLVLVPGASLVSEVAVASGALFAVGAGSSAGAVTTAGQTTNAGTIAALTVTGGTTDNAGTVSGATTVTGGTLNLNAGSDLSDADLLTVNGGTVNVNVDEVVAALAGTGGTVNLAAGLTIGGGDASSTYGGALTGAGTLTKEGTGTQILGGNSTHTGALAIDEGTLRITGSTDSATIATGADGTLETDGGALDAAAAITNAGQFTIEGPETVASVNGAGGITLDGAGAVLTLTTGASAISGVIDGAGGLAVNGATAAVTLTGDNTYAGPTTVTAGALTIGTAAPDSGSVASNVSVGAAGSLTVAGGGTVTGNVGSAGTGANAGLIDGALTVSGGTFTNTGEVTGATTVTAGTLNLNAGSDLSDANALTVNGGTVNVNVDEAVGALAGTGGTVNLTGDLTAGGNDASTTYGGVIAGTGTLTKEGTGTLTLAGSNGGGSDFTGTVEVDGGTLQVNGSFGDSAGNAMTLNVNAGGTLQGTGTVLGDVNVNAGGTLAAGASPGVLEIAGDLVLDGGSTTEFELGAANAMVPDVANDVILVGGNLTLGGMLDITSASLADGYYRLFEYGGGLTDNTLSIGLNPGGTATVLTNIDGQVNLRVGNGPADQYWDGAGDGGNGAVDGGDGTWNAANTNWTIQNGNFNDQWLGNNAIFAGTAGTVTVEGTQNVSNLSFQTSGYLLTGAGGLALNPGGGGIAVAGGTAEIGVVISGVEGVNKTGAGTLILSGDNTYAGDTTVTGGTLRITGAIDSAAVTVQSGASLEAASGLPGGALRDDAAVTLNGTGNLTLGADETIGALNSASATSTVTLDGNTLTVGAGSFAGVIGPAGDAGGLTKTGPGTLTLSGDSLYTGETAVEGGVLVVSGSIASAVVTVEDTGSLHVGGGSLIDTAAVTLNGTGDLTLTDDETIGSLTSASAASTVTLGANTLTLGEGDFAGVIGAGGDAGGLTKTGAGTLILRGDNQYTGDTAVEGGTLELAAGAGIDSGSVTVSNDATLLTAGGALDAATEVTVEDTATLDVGAGAEAFAALTQTGGTVTGAGGSIDLAGAFTQSGAASTTAGALTITAGSFTQSDGATIADGTEVNASGAQTLNGGTIAGQLTGTGPVTVQTGTTTLEATGLIAGPTTIASQLDVNGGEMSGAVTNNGTLNIAGGTFSGGLTNNATATAQGAISGTLTNAGGGTFTLAGNITGGSIASFTNAGTTTIGGFTFEGVGTYANSGTTTLDPGGVLRATAINNTGGITLAGATLNGSVTNGGTITVSGASAIDGALSGGGVVDLTAVAGDHTLTLTGAAGAVGPHTFLLNYDNAGVGDRLVAGSAGVFGGGQFFDITLSGDFGLATQAILVQGQTGIANTFAVGGATLGGAVIYSVIDSGGNTVLVAESNPGVGGIASGVSLTQALISNVVNRPSSPFASGLAAEQGCSQGGYFRGIVGRSSADGSSFNGITRRANELSARYGGVQAGWDIGCNDGRFLNGWDGAVGALVGYNLGSTDQPIRLNLGSGTPTLTSTTTTDFRQSYVGLYVVGNRDRLTLDAQLRFENTKYTLNETVEADFEGLGLDDSSFSAKGVNFTGRLSYRLDLNDDGLNFVPTAGVSITRTGASRLDFTNGNVLDLHAYTSTVGFIGGTIAKSRINEAGDAGSTVFGSLNYYREFGGDRTSTFTTATGETTPITATPIEGFGEASVGWNYVKILESGPGGAKQLNANIRADARFGGNVSNSYSLTAQVRLSF